MADFADSSATTLDVELLAQAAAGRLSPALPVGEQLLEANLYAVCDLVAAPGGPGVERAAVPRDLHALLRRAP